MESIYDLSKKFGIPVIDLDCLEVDPTVLRLMPREVGERHVIFPVARQGNTFIIAMADPENLFAIDDMKFLTGLDVEPVLAEKDKIIARLPELHGCSLPEEFIGVMPGVREDNCGKKYVELVSRFDFGQVVWATQFNHTTYDSTYEVVGPAAIDWMDGDMKEPGVMRISSYGLEGLHKHDGFYDDCVFATEAEATAARDRHNACVECRHEANPTDADCDNCPCDGD